VDSGLDPDSVAAVVHSIIFGLNRLGGIRDATFDVKAASDMLNLLFERFLRPQTIRAAKQVQHPERKEDARTYRRQRRGVQG
jgi:hypothetical protein